MSRGACGGQWSGVPASLRVYCAALSVLLVPPGCQPCPLCSLPSMNGHSVVPQSVVHFYSATKYAVTALTEGLRQELREARTHIRATVSAQGFPPSPCPAGRQLSWGRAFPFGEEPRGCKNRAQHAGNAQEILWLSLPARLGHTILPWEGIFWVGRCLFRGSHRQRGVGSLLSVGAFPCFSLLLCPSGV